VPRRSAICTGTECKSLLCYRCLLIFALVEYFLIKICVTSFCECGEFPDKHLGLKRFVRQVKCARCAEGPVYNIYHPNTAVCISLPVTEFTVVMLFLSCCLDGDLSRKQVKAG